MKRRLATIALFALAATALYAQSTATSFTTTTTLSIPAGCKDTVAQTATQVVITQICTVTPTPPALTGNTTITLPPATVGKAYSVNAAALIAATGGVPPYHYTAGTGFPAWLSISSAGVLSGTPTASGSFTITITTTDSGGTSATSFIFTIGAADNGR